MAVVTAFMGSLLIAAGAAQEAPAPAPPRQEGAPQAAAQPERPEGFDLAKLKIEQCPGERFDFQVGERSKVGLCSNAGASNEEIAAMLESAIEQLESTDRMQPDVRDQIVAQIRTKILEVRGR